MWGMITALVSGALMSIQGVFNSAVMKQTSMWVSAGWVQISAFVVCLVMWLFTGRSAVSELWQIEPRYMLTGGVIGAFITYTVIKSFDALGPAKSALLIVVAQILVAYLIEVFGWFGVEKAGFEWRKAIGAAVAIAGIVIAIRLRFEGEKGRFALPIAVLIVFASCYIIGFFVRANSGLKESISYMIGETGDFGIAIALIVLSLIVWFASYKYSMRVMKKKEF